MLENGFYKVKQEYIDLIREVGGIYKDAKERLSYEYIIYVQKQDYEKASYLIKYENINF